MVEVFLNLRNAIASISGLKTGKILKFVWKSRKNKFQTIPNEWRYFLFFLKGKNHLITELKDKHLDSRFSILIRQEDVITNVSLTTIVKI